MDYKLDYENPLFHELSVQNPVWWQNLKNDKDIYCDIRKDNYLNFYYNGGSIMKLCWDNGFKAEIHCEYIPLKNDRPYLPFEFGDNGVRLTSREIIDIQNFAKNPLARIKKRIRKFNPNNSEKGLQGNYVTKAFQAKNHNGFFIDTEFEYQGKRMDLVWVDLKLKKIAFVELKRTADAGLFSESGPNHQSVDDQLKKYAAFIKKNQAELLAYYDLVYRIKKKLGLLKGFSRFKSLMHFELLEKPILLVGDCSQEWIDDHADQINAKVSKYAFGAVYQGPRTFGFQIPLETEGNSFCFQGSKETYVDTETGWTVTRETGKFSFGGKEVVSLWITDPETGATSKSTQLAELPETNIAEWVKDIARYSEMADRFEREQTEKLHSIYPELAQGAEVPKGPLGAIKLHFAKSFAHWGIILPDKAAANRERGKINHKGWSIWYLFGSDETGEYLDYYSAHRMTNDGHTRIYEDGRTEGLPAIADFRPCSSDPEEDARLKKEQHEEDMRITAILEAKGFGISGDEPSSVQIQRYQRVQKPEE